jgi:hypothetical protein
MHGTDKPNLEIRPTQFLSSSLNTVPPDLLNYRTTVLTLTNSVILMNICYATEQALLRDRILLDDNFIIHHSNKFKSISHQS